MIRAGLMCSAVKKRSGSTLVQATVGGAVRTGLFKEEAGLWAGARASGGGRILAVSAGSIATLLIPLTSPLTKGLLYHSSKRLSSGHQVSGYS